MEDPSAVFLERWRRAGSAPALVRRWGRIARTMVRRWQWGVRFSLVWLRFAHLLVGRTVRHWRRFARAAYKAWLGGQMELSKKCQDVSTWQLEEWSARMDIDPTLLNWLCDLLAMRDEQQWRRLP